MPKQTAPIARNLNTTAQAAEQNGVEASIFGGFRDVLKTGLPIAAELANRYL